MIDPKLIFFMDQLTSRTKTVIYIYCSEEKYNLNEIRYRKQIDVRIISCCTRFHILFQAWVYVGMCFPFSYLCL